jgi:GNAT superfamily N-acetyltransferase
VELKGINIHIRPVLFTDEREMRRLFYSFSDESRYYRFFGVPTTFPHEKVQEFVSIDYDENLTLIGLVKASSEQERIIAAGRYSLDRSTNTAEVSFEVHEEYQNKGIATFLLRYLIQIARQRGIKAFTAEVLPNNSTMLRVFHKVVPKLLTSMEKDVIFIHFELDKVKI